MFRLRKNHQSGFTLIEVLVSMLIMAIGLLGIALMQGRALKANRDAYLYGQANLLAYEMADKIRANADYWRTNIPTADLGNGCDSPADNCTSEQMAAFDYARWQADVAALLPTTTKNAAGSTIIYSPYVQRVTEPSGNTVCPYVNETSLCIYVRFVRNDTTTITNAMGTTVGLQRLGVTL